MRILPFVCLLIGCCFAAPNNSGTSAEDTANSTIVIDNLIKDDYVIYTAEHDIVRIFAPFDQSKLKKNPWADMWSIESSSSSEEDTDSKKVFFVEADHKNGAIDKLQGLYLYSNGKVTKLLENGRDAIANNENEVYFAANDGIYKYNKADNKAQKHGDVNDNILQFAFYNVTNSIYYVTVNHEVFKLNNEATASEKVTEIKDVQALVFGYDKKIYYYDSKNNVFVYDDVNKVAPKKIEGLPTKIDRLALISPLLGMEEGSLLLVNKVLYLIKPDATVNKSKARVEGRPTAYEPKPTYIQYYAENKKLYELNTLEIIQKTGLAIFH